MGIVKIKQNTHSMLYSLQLTDWTDKSAKVIYINWTTGKEQKKSYVKNNAEVTGIQNINQKLTSTLLRWLQRYMSGWVGDDFEHVAFVLIR